MKRVAPLILVLAAMGLPACGAEDPGPNEEVRLAAERSNLAKVLQATGFSEQELRGEQPPSRAAGSGYSLEAWDVLGSKYRRLREIETTLRDRGSSFYDGDFLLPGR